MKVNWLLLFITIFLLVPNNTNAKQLSSVDKLDEISDEALQMVKYQKYEDAEQLLNYFSAQFTSVAKTIRPLTADEIRIVTVSRDEAMEAAVSSNMNYQERISRFTKFRLVIDAITTRHQPMWTDLQDKIMAALEQVKVSANNGDMNKFNTDFNAFLSLYNVIYPSMEIDVPAESIQKLDARINNIDAYRTQMTSNPKNIAELDGLEADLKKIFSNTEQDQADPSLWWVIISTGSIIIMTLSYVGWRKYQADRDIKKDQSREYKD